MKLYDCFMYFDEDLVLDFRLNILNNYFDKFVIEIIEPFPHVNDRKWYQHHADGKYDGKIVNPKPYD